MADAPAPLAVAHPSLAIRIRPWHADDAGALAHAANHPEVARFLRDRFPHPYTLADAESFLRDVAAPAPAQYLAIEVDGRVAGGCGVHPGSDIGRHGGELGYWLTRAYWRRGVMSAVVATYAPAAMAAHDLVRLWATVDVANLGSQRVLANCGFQREGLLRAAHVKHGRFSDAVLYARIDDARRQRLQAVS